ncbi:MAG: 50S ribosomal protein L13 [Candidatus Coatesbacteria bacterium]|nr:MAG: 50S ribosomal protein L13 [Candidatus Coatesbacteria bacterium]
MKRKTYTPKKNDIERRWYVIDADGAVLGRLATEVANVIRGKHKPYFTPHLDTGDFVIVINAEKVALTGKKLIDKIYYRHSGYVGNLKEISAGKLLEMNPEKVVLHAVRGMLPKNRLGRKLLTKVKVYRGNSHPHEAQTPERWVIGAGPAAAKG